MLFFVCLIQFFSYATPILPEDLEENLIYESILQEPYYDNKIELGKKLGQIANQSSNEKLLKKLLENTYHWNREAALAGILLGRKDDFKEILIQQFLTDPILRFSLRKEFRNNIHFYINELTRAYEQEKNLNRKNLLLGLIVISPDYEKYLRKNTEKHLEDNRKILYKHTNEKPERKE